MTKNNIRADVRSAIESLGNLGQAIGSTGHLMGKAATAARDFEDAAARVGSVIDRDSRRGTVEELFNDPGVRVGRASEKVSSTKRRAEGLLDDADPTVETGNLTRARRIVETAGQMSRAMGISAQEATDALSSVMSAGVSLPESQSPQERAPVATGAKAGEVKEERCKIGTRLLRDEDDSTESE